MENRGEILTLITQQLTELNATLAYEEFLEINEATTIWGTDSGLDSLALVRFAVELEEVLQDRFGPAIVLSDESAMAADPSPFESVGALADFTAAQLESS